jgi:hypothetical protein
VTSDIDARTIAERIRGIIGGQDAGIIEATARRLSVSEVALRMSVDEHEPHPTIEVIAAVVREHGVDPSWLISGQYDSATHRAALGEEAALSRAELVRLVANQLSTADRPDIAGPHLRMEA